MTLAGIEHLNLYAGVASIDTAALLDARGLDPARFDNMMMRRKSVNLPCEDPVTNAVNAAKPILDRMGEEERSRIELLITATESGVDYGKSMATYVHRHLGLPARCRVFEMKQACYAGTAALQLAVSHVVAGLSPGAKALVIATDIAWPAGELAYAELSQGVAGVAMIIGDDPQILSLDLGATGHYAAEVQDTCRPDDKTETGDTDLSLMAYIDGLDNSVADYMERVDGADFRESFQYLAFHTPFGGMVRGAHRNIMRRRYKAKPDEIASDFETRVSPAMRYCQETGNAYSASLYVALAGLIDSVGAKAPFRVGLYSYGSGSCAEFFSGVVPPGAAARLGALGIGEHLATRVGLDVAQYDAIVASNGQWRAGMKEHRTDMADTQGLLDSHLKGTGRLILTGVEGYQRQYDWV